jgi:DNA-directed RNA polymerase subunit E'/Rpb7
MSSIIDSNSIEVMGGDIEEDEEIYVVSDNEEEEEEEEDEEEDEEKDEEENLSIVVSGGDGESAVENLDDIYNKIIIKEYINIKSKQLNKKLHENIKQNIIYRIENKCIHEGYVKENSIEIINIDSGILKEHNFYAQYTFYVTYSVLIANPPIDSVIKATIKNINKFGINLTKGPLDIICPREIHENKKIFNDLTIGQNIDISIITKRFKFNDTVIEVFGKIYTGSFSKKTSTIIKVRKTVK